MLLVVLLALGACSKAGDSGNDANAAGDGGQGRENASIGGKSARGGTTAKSESKATGGTTSTGGATATGGSTTTAGTNGVLTIADKTVLEATCAGWADNPVGAPSKLEIVLDLSSSMMATPLDSPASKLEMTRDALLEAIVGVKGPGLGANVSAGILFYPRNMDTLVSSKAVDSTTCINTSASVPMAVMGDAQGTQRQTIANALKAVSVGSGTPTHDAYQFALENVVLSSSQQAIPGASQMLLITDGAPTLQLGCYNTAGTLDDSKIPHQPIIDEVANAYAKGIKTFVIALPGAEAGRDDDTAYDWLSAAAKAGGTASEGCADTGPNYCHWDLTKAYDLVSPLREALSSVIAAMSGCSFEIPTVFSDGHKTVDPERVEPVVTYSSGRIELIGRDRGVQPCAGEGYRLLSPTQLQLCSSTCDRYHADSKAKLQFFFDCNG